MKSAWILAAALAGVCVGTLPVRAQVPQPSSEMLPRPYSGVYGGNAANAAGLAHLFEGTFSGWGGTDDNSFPQQFTEAAQSIGGPYSAAAAAFSYAWRSRTLAIGANASSQTRYYSDLGDFLDGIHAGGVGFEASLGSRTRIQAQQTIGFSPLFAVNPFPVLGTPDLGASVPPNADLTLAQRDSRLLGTTAGFSHVLDGRSSLGAGYGYSSSAYSGEIPDLRYHTVTATWDRRFARTARLGARYIFQDAQYTLGAMAAPVKTQEATFEIGRQWVHSRTRRSDLRVSLGAVFVNTENVSPTRPVGSVQFSSLIGQSWDVIAAYRRGTELTGGLTDVTYVDTLGVSIRGLVTRRLDASLSASYASGEVGFDQLRNRYTAYTGTARVGFAVHRVAALFCEGYYYSEVFDFARDPANPNPGRDLERMGFRAGVSWWLPIVRERQSSGTR